MLLQVLMFMIPLSCLEELGKLELGRFEILTGQLSRLLAHMSALAVFDQKQCKSDVSVTELCVLLDLQREMLWCRAPSAAQRLGHGEVLQGPQCSHSPPTLAFCITLMGEAARMSVSLAGLQWIDGSIAMLLWQS